MSPMFDLRRGQCLVVRLTREVEAHHPPVHDLPLRLRRQRLRSVARVARLGRRRRCDARIGIAVIYHGLGARDGDRAYELAPAVGTRLFDEQLRHLQAHYHVVRPSELLNAAAERRPGSPVPVALTFDDDLRAHTELAAPALERAGVGAGFFLCGASLDRPTSFWWEDLQALV